MGVVPGAAGRAGMTLREHLCVPYLVAAEAIEDEDRQWRRRAAHPELPECWAVAAEIERTMERLERRRVDVILDLLRRGARVPVPRPPLGDMDAEGLLRRLGHAALVPLLDAPASRLADGRG